MRFITLILFIFPIFIFNHPLLYSQENSKNAFLVTPTLKAISKDNYEISFETKEFCDVTIFVKNNNGDTIRHLASGLLGSNAPMPFQKNSKKQTIVWNGKDDQGKLMDNVEGLKIDVCLGVKAQFERTLNWSPYRRTKSPKYRSDAPLITATPEGVYVYDGGSSENVKLFDHEGVYQKAVFPIAAKYVNKDTGYIMKEFPQDKKLLPQKGSSTFNQLLNTGVAEEISWNTKDGSKPESMFVYKDELYLAEKRLNIIHLKNNTIARNGPIVWQGVSLSAMHEYKGGFEKLGPESLAISSDGKWMYATGYFYSRSWLQGGLNGVLKIKLNSTEPGTVFVGEMKAGKKADDKNAFDVASCVAVDQKGNVLVGDYGNHRIQVFSSEGKHIKNIPVEFPTNIQINPHTQELYVFSWAVPYAMQSGLENKLMPKLNILKSLDDPSVISTYDLPISKAILDGYGAHVAVDFWASEIRIWVANSGTTASWIAANEADASIKIYNLKNKKFEVIKDFHKETKKISGWALGVRSMKQRLFFDYKNEKLLVGELYDPHPEHVTAIANLVSIDVKSGEEKIINLPFDAEDLAFDLNGLAYLRSFNNIARFDAQNWREVPFDYGSEVLGLTSFGIYKKDVVSGLAFECDKDSTSQYGGMAVSPTGNVAVTTFLTNPDKSKNVTMYKGRAASYQVQIWNSRGQKISSDAVMGIGRPVGVNMDALDNLYLMIAGRGKSKGELYYHPISCTYVKTKTGGRFLNSEAKILPLKEDDKPKREPEIIAADMAGDTWTDGADWILGGVGFDGKRNHCRCASQSRAAIDLYARSFLPEIDRYSVLVVDTNGNELLRFGKYGNIEDGLPLITKGGPTQPNSIGGDEVALMHCQMLAVQSNKRVFLGDVGNERVVSVVLNYDVVKSLDIK